ncbi:hypothetical protein Vadar_007019 [Vaccinium darrowii]|uniref:Uncharacterized protein n=1 Tax=Vaccinium darrowii TaxID=229202 RepID=A0ACB7YBZ9_9ERIC|nr:hypothetical protein Vadar_007019 [Vaccinium darrowii]
MGEAAKDVNPALDLCLSLGGCYTQNPDSITSSLNQDSNPNPNQKEIVLTDFFAVRKSPPKPTEAEIVVRRVKEMQATKRMEAKKRLLEKYRKGILIGGGYREEKPPVGTTAVAENELASWTVDSALRNNAFCRAVDKLKNNVGPSHSLKTQGPEISIEAKFPTVSQPTIISMQKENGKSVSQPTIISMQKETGKSVLANYRSVERSPIPGRALSTSAVMLDKMENGKRASPSTPCQANTPDKKFKKGRILPDGAAEMNQMFKLMPSVTTTGNGPNGRKIEGFLYRYLTGKVRIVCVCHGSFLSPAEFVKHASGHHEGNPMKYINVLSSPL